MHQAKNLTWKQERFFSEYLMSGNAVLRLSGEQAIKPAILQKSATASKEIRGLEQLSYKLRRLELDG